MFSSSSSSNNNNTGAGQQQKDAKSVGAVVNGRTATTTTSNDENSPNAIVIIGAGAFGTSTAIALALRGHQKVVLVDPVLPVTSSLKASHLDQPHPSQPVSSSHDISKILRGDYGKDAFYFELFQRAWKKWKQLEDKWRAVVPKSMFHWTGVGFVTGIDTTTAPPQPLDNNNSNNMTSSSFERVSFEELTKQPELPQPTLLDSTGKIRSRLRGLNRGVAQYDWGYWNPIGGWGESGRILAQMHQDAAELGVQFMSHSAATLLRSGDKVVGARLTNGQEILGSMTLVCCGAWTRFLVSETKELVKASAMSVFHLERPLPDTLVPDCPVTLDISQSGFYIFPFHPSTSVIKIGHHGAGYPLEEPASRASLDALAKQLRPIEEVKFRKYLSLYLPDLAQAKIANFLICQYCDSHNGDFLIDRVPGTTGLLVACGGSGHGFKFASVIGDIVADVVENKENPDPIFRVARQRFAWRSADVRGSEEARAKL